jgi:hypothetical protein
MTSDARARAVAGENERPPPGSLNKAAAALF